jgi:hypothetical protein
MYLHCVQYRAVVKIRTFLETMFYNFLLLEEAFLEHIYLTTKRFEINVAKYLISSVFVFGQSRPNPQNKNEDS